MSQPHWNDLSPGAYGFPEELKNEVLTSTLKLLFDNKFIEDEAIENNEITYQRRFHNRNPDDNAIKIGLVKKDDYDYVRILMQKYPGRRSYCWIEFFKDTTTADRGQDGAHYDGHHPVCIYYHSTCALE